MAVRRKVKRSYLERVRGLLLSVQRLQRVQELSVHSEDPLVVSRHRQLGVVGGQAVELDGEPQVHWCQ